MQLEKNPRLPRVLVVEDDPDAREALKEVLEERGFSVSDACNGKVALDMMTSQLEPEVVILDLDMPIMSGAELLDAMRAHDRLAGVPVLIVSGSDKAALPRADGIVGFEPKPCDIERLITTLRSCVATSDA